MAKTFDFKTNPTRVASNPGYAFGRQGNIPANSWLNSEGIPSNIVGIPFGLFNGTLDGVWVGNENVATFNVEVYHHLGNGISLTLIDTVSVVATRIFSFTFALPNSIPKDTQLAVRLTSGSSKNTKVYLDVKGTRA